MNEYSQIKLVGNILEKKKDILYAYTFSIETSI
jgi:hypothetical protein